MHHFLYEKIKSNPSLIYEKMIGLLMTNTMYGSLHHSHSLSRHSKSNLRKLSTNFHHFSITIIEEQHRFSSNRLIRLFNIIENSYFEENGSSAVVVQRSCLYQGYSGGPGYGWVSSTPFGIPFRLPVQF